MARLEKAYSRGVWLAMVMDGNVVPEDLQQLPLFLAVHFSNRGFRAERAIGFHS